MALAKFTLVEITGEQDGKPYVRAWSPSSYEQPGLDTAHKILGVSMTDALDDEPVAVMKRGYLRDCAEQNSETWNIGDVLWACGDGSITNVRPAAPFPLVLVGTVFRDEGDGGPFSIDVDVRVLPSIAELSNVKVETLVNKDVLIFDATNHYFVPRQIDHGSDLAGLGDDDHPQYTLETDFIHSFLFMGGS